LIKTNNLDQNNGGSSAIAGISDLESFRGIIQKEFDQFNGFYTSFIDNCRNQLSNLHNESLNSSPRLSYQAGKISSKIELKKQIEKPFEFDIGFFKDVLVGVVRELLENDANLEISNNGGANNNLKGLQKINLL